MFGYAAYAMAEAQKKQEEASIVKHDLVFCNSCGCHLLLDANGKTSNCAHETNKWEKAKLTR